MVDDHCMCAAARGQVADLHGTGAVDTVTADVILGEPAGITPHEDLYTRRPGAALPWLPAWTCPPAPPTTSPD